MYSHCIHIICSDNSDNSWNNLCDTCKDRMLLSELYHLNDANLQKKMTWYQWKMVPGKNRKEHFEKTMKRDKTIGAFNYACEILTSFLLDYVIKQKQ